MSSRRSGSVLAARVFWGEKALRWRAFVWSTRPNVIKTQTKIGFPEVSGNMFVYDIHQIGRVENVCANVNSPPRK